MTADYYDEHATTYAEATIGLDMADLYQPFLHRLPVNARILDAGCGPGRDTKAFENMGYTVSAFDASGEMVALARKHGCSEVHHATFKEFSTPNFGMRYHGVWACASLLHVPLTELASTMEKLGGWLLPGGVLYCSFKEGQGEVMVDGRHFTFIDHQTLVELAESAEFDVEVIWHNQDVRQDKPTQVWINALLLIRDEV